MRGGGANVVVAPVTKLEKIEGGALILLVHGVKQQGCIYDEKLDITTSFTYFRRRHPLLTM